GSKIRLQEQPFQILLSLLERPGEVMSREELRTKLWPADTFVDFDHSLNAAVRRLRDALGDSADMPRFVETVARRGYRFIAPINKAAVSSEVPLVQAKPGHSRRWWAIFAGSLALLIVGLVAGFHAGQSRSSSQAPTSRRLTANPSEIPVLGQAISHDGKYLAFADTSGFYIRQIDTGETHALSLPSAGRIAFVSAKYEHDMFGDTGIETINLASGHQGFVFTQAGLGPGLIWTSDNRLLFSLREPSPSQDDSNVWSVGIDEATGRISGPRHRMTSAPGY